MEWTRVASLAVAACLSTGTMHAQTKSLNVLKLRTVADTQAFFHWTGHDVPIISGHRGGVVKRYPENSIPAFEHTLSITPAIFEIDPRMTKDGIPVLMHDPTLDRTTTGHGKLADYTLAQVRRLNLKDGDGNVTPYHPSTLEEAIEWCIGKTVLNLDIKDVPPIMKADLVRKHDAYANVIFTVHSAEEAKSFYDYDKRSLFAAVIFNPQDLKSYEAAGIPWSNIVIGYVGPRDKVENQPLYRMLHQRGVMVMVAAAPVYDKFATLKERADAYRKILQDGVDVIESDRPIEVAAAIRPLYPKHSTKYKYWGRSIPSPLPTPR